jgi:hypothetical protein
MGRWKTQETIVLNLRKAAESAHLPRMRFRFPLLRWAYDRYPLVALVRGKSFAFLVRLRYTTFIRRQAVRTTVS